MPGGGCLGFPCQHLYECETDLLGTSSQGTTPNGVNGSTKLKGADAFLYLAALQVGYEPSIVTLVDCQDGGDGMNFATKDQLTLERARNLTAPEFIEDEFWARGMNCEVLEGLKKETLTM